jgi:hypothetical protein
MGTSQGLVPKLAARSASYGGRHRISPAPAAAAFTDETRRRVKAGNPEPVTVTRLDGAMDTDWNASSDVADVLAATGWTARCADPAYAVAWRLRDEVVDILEAILVTAG